MSAPTRKQSVPGRVESPTPSASPARGHAARASVSGAGTPLARRQSMRASTPVSARAAVQRRDSPLGNTSEAGDARAESKALIEDLNTKLRAAESESERVKRQSDILQSKLDEVHKEQAKLEEKVHENEEQIESHKNEKRDMARRMREMEAIYEAERASMTNEKEDMSNREEEMQMVIQRLKDTLAQRVTMDEEPRQSRHTNSSPGVDTSGSFAPPNSVQRSDSRNSSKILLQKDKLIESLRLELAEAQIKLTESENQGGGRLLEVERLLMEARMANARLMEDNESYQLLLQEKTLNGDFTKNDFGFMAANQDALNALEGRSSNGDPDHPERVSHGMSSLADELSDAQEDDERARRLEAELKSSRDQNKALTLYINKIIERLLQHQEFESILDQSQEYKPGANVNKELPLPPTPKGHEFPQHQKQPSSPAPSLLQRAKTMTIGGNQSQPTIKPKPRPMSLMPTSSPASTVSAHEDPERAPSIPLGLGRSKSVRRSRPMSEQFIGAANVVNQMYKGPDRPNGTTSPSLVSPRSSTAGHFFPKRSSSGAAVATSGNFPGMKSETSSTMSSTISSGADSVGFDLSTSGASPQAGNSSPPRSRDPNQHEKMATFKGGDKPRPLRLVQENDASQQANKRSSWFGWINQPKKEDGPPQTESIRE